MQKSNMIFRIQSFHCNNNFKSNLYLAIYALILSPIKFILQFLIFDFIYWEWTLANIPILRITIIDFIFFIPFIVWFPFFLYVAINFVGNTLVPGANDNLSGVAIALAIGKYLADAEHRPENVEVWIGSFGAEEVGQRGSKAFVEEYGKRGILDNSLTIVLESVGGGEGMGILSAEKMYFAWHSKEVYEPLFTAFQKYKSETKGVVPCKVHESVFAGTDAIPFTYKGLSPVNIYNFVGMTPSKIKYRLSSIYSKFYSSCSISYPFL